MRRTGLLYGSAQISTILECQRASQRPPYGWRWRLCFFKNGNVAIRVHLVATFGWYFTFNPPPWVRRQFWLIRGLADSASPRFPPFCHHSSTWRPLTACRHIATLLLPPPSHTLTLTSSSHNRHFLKHCHHDLNQYVFTNHAWSITLNVSQILPKYLSIRTCMVDQIAQ